MNYDHARKAGNRADVWKHFWLCELVRGLRPDQTGCVSVLDCHCGAGLYDRRKAEQWDDGIGRFAGNAADSLGCFGRVVASYLRRDLYPGSWLLAAEILKNRNVPFRIHGCDISPEVSKAFRDLGPDIAQSNCYEFTRGDGYGIASRGEPQSLVFLDPPYSPDADRDWQALARLMPVVKTSAEVVAIWYPIEDGIHRQPLLTSCGLLRHEISWQHSSEGWREKMTGCGLAVWARQELDLQAAEQTACDIARLIDGMYAKHTPGNG